MKTTLLLLLALAPLVGCRSTRSAAPDFECICGTPVGAMEQCLHARCAAGENNPDNPDCACGTMSLDN